MNSFMFCFYIYATNDINSDLILLKMDTLLTLHIKNNLIKKFVPFSSALTSHKRDYKRKK